MKNIILEHNTSGLFTIQVVVATGSIHEAKGIMGISHLLEHMLFKSKRHMSTSELLSKLDRVGGSFNAATSKDWTTYYIHAIAKEWSSCVDLMHTIVFDCEFVEKELHKERRVVIEELLQSNDEPTEVVFDFAYKTFLAKDNPYRSQVIGTVKDLLSITVTDLKNQYDKYYKNKSNVMFYINCPVGIHTEVQSKIQNKFKNVMSDFVPVQTPWTTSLQSSSQSIKVRNHENLSQNATCIIFEGFAFDNSNNMVLEFIWDFLVGGLNSLLMLEIREKRGYIYGMSSFMDSYRDAGVTGMIFTSSHKKTEDIVKVIFDILSKVQREGLSESALAYTKASYINKLRYRLTNRDYQQEIRLWNHFYGLKRSTTHELKSIARITNQDIISICKIVFDINKMAIVSIGNYADPSSTERAISSTLATSTAGKSG